MAPMAKLRIRELRKARGWTSTVLAERAGIARSYMSEIETGKKPANTYRLESIADALGVAVSDLFEDDGAIPGLASFIEDFCALPPEFQEREAANLRTLRAMLSKARAQKE